MVNNITSKIVCDKIVRVDIDCLCKAGGLDRLTGRD